MNGNAHPAESSALNSPGRALDRARPIGFLLAVECGLVVLWRGSAFHFDGDIRRPLSNDRRDAKSAGGSER